jgi:hypothetical protein
MISEGDEIRCEYDGCKLGEGSGWNSRFCDCRRPRGDEVPPKATANRNVGILPTWPTPIGPLCQNSNALTPPRPEPVWFSLVHSSPSRLAPLTASTEQIQVPFCRFVIIFSKFFRNFTAGCTIDILSACDELKWQKIPAGHRWIGVGVWVWEGRSLHNLHCRI